MKEYDILEKVFYEGNEKLPGGKYTLTVVNIETGERIELKVKLNAKEDFIVGVIYRIEYYEDEVRYVSDEISSLLQKGYKPSDIAILFVKNSVHCSILLCFLLSAYIIA